MTKAEDHEYEEFILDEVRSDDEGHSLTFDHNMGFYLPKGPITPEPGMTARFYGKGFGSVVRGVDINGHEFFYRTPEQQEQKHAEDLAKQEAKDEIEFQNNRDSLDADFNALPPEFQRRIQRFRNNNSRFRVNSEKYEMFCCKQAVAMAMGLGTTDKIQEFRELKFEDQLKLVPELSDQHSGNTFGAACRLAWLYIARPSDVEREHGALCPLLGCKEYGCVPENFGTSPTRRIRVGDI